MYSGLQATGPNALIQHVFFSYHEEYTHMFWMEPDSHPVRDNWLEGLLRQILAAPALWISGTHYARYVDKEWQSVTHRLHINGNALYNLRSSCFHHIFLALLSLFPDQAWDLSLDCFLRGVGHAFSEHYVHRLIR